MFFPQNTCNGICTVAAKGRIATPFCNAMSGQNGGLGRTGQSDAKKKSQSFEKIGL
jgi:hypothetical protein